MRRFPALLIVLLLTSVPASADEPPLAEVLRDGDAAAKKRAMAKFRTEAPDEKHQLLLRAALKDADRGVRQMAAVVLAEAGAKDGAVIDELIRGMAQPWTPSYRSLPDDPLAARRGLTKVGEKAVPALVAALEDKKYPARAPAVWALGEIGKPAKAALPAIEAAIRDRDVPALHHTIEAKYHIDGDAAFAIKHLVPLLDTKAGRNCGGANRVIARMGADAKGAVPALIAAMRKYKEDEICYDLVALAPHFRDQIVLALRKALDDPELAASASRALWEIGEPGVAVDVAELGKNPGKYNWMAVRVELVLGDFVPAERWSYGVVAKGTVPIGVQGTGKSDARGGDRVAITGVFRYEPNTSDPRTMIQARMEVLPETVGAADLVRNADKYHGRLVRVGATLKHFLAADDWIHAVKVASGCYIEVSGKGKHVLRDGDTVAFTGRFEHAKGTFVPYSMSGCTVEKMGPKKP